MSGNQPGAARKGRKTRARAIVEMLQLAQDELDAVRRETNMERMVERATLARRLIADALAAIHRWEVLG